MITLRAGDHVCAVYDTDEQLIATAADFLADGLERSERCWYVPSGMESEAIRAALEARGVDVEAAVKRSALRLLDTTGTYAIRGVFDPEQTMRVFSDAIEQALGDGFHGFRAAAEMSWVVDTDQGATTLIEYEVLLKTLFSTSAATGLCLYDRRRMPLPIVNGALLTHPIVATGGRFMPNVSYDPAVRGLSDVDQTAPTPRRAGPRSGRIGS